ncbi:MAG TPA: hypothetical protein VII56_09135 [Rhizomicrobium sp.]
MKKQTAMVLVLAAICLAAPAWAQYGGATGPASENSTDPSGDHRDSGPRSLPPDPEGKAEDLRLNGKCDQAIPIFRALASYGAGFEIAHYNLGLCLLEISKSEPDAGRAAGLKQAAAVSILKAANAGLPKPQALLVTMYLDGVGVAPDPVAAGTWALIYHENGARLALGLANIPPDLQARLDSALTQTSWAQAQARADAWTPIAAKN